MRILFVGPQGSGKSTQGKLLAEYLQIPYISTGDIFRRLATQDFPESIKAKEALATGNLVDDQTTAQIVIKRLTEDDTKGGFILDGYPRTIKQIEIYDPGFDRVIYLDLKDEDALERLNTRGREDDIPDLIEKRLELYRKQTDPILDYYRGKGILVSIDAKSGIDEIQQKIREVVNG